MLSIIKLMHMDQQELIRNVHTLSTWVGDKFTSPECQDHAKIHDWITRSGWQSPTYNEFHSRAAQIKVAELEAIREKFPDDSHEVEAAKLSLVNTLLARYGLALPGDAPHGKKREPEHG